MDMICTKKGVKKPFMPKSKVWRLNEDTTRVEFENEFQRLAGGPSDTVCSWTKRPLRHRIT